MVRPGEVVLYHEVGSAPPLATSASEPIASGAGPTTAPPGLGLLGGCSNTGIPGPPNWLPTSDSFLKATADTNTHKGYFIVFHGRLNAALIRQRNSSCSSIHCRSLEHS